MTYQRVLYTALVLAAFSACKKDDAPDPPTSDPISASEVVFEMDEVPYNTLSEYNFFSGELSELSPVAGVLPYELITPLFTDYAKKKRFIWMPEGTSGQYDGDSEVFDFNDGAVLIKHFYYDNVLPDNSTRIIETRLLYKKDGAWNFAEYVWNEEQTEATFDLSGSFTDVEWTDDDGVLRSVNYRLPSEAECLTCHKRSASAAPLGPRPENLDKAFDYIGEVKNQIDKWTEMGYLSGDIPATINSVVAWDDPTELLSDRVRAYVAVNCSSCHRDDSHCDYRSMRFAYNESTEPENMGICVEPDENIGSAFTHIITPGRADRSVIAHRMQSTDESVRMPLLGRSMVHEEAVALITEYINSLTDPPCE